MKKMISVAVLWTTMLGAGLAHGADFFCSAGNVPCIIAAIDAGNWNGQDNNIILEPGIYLVTAVNNTVDGPNGLPSVKGRFTIRQDDPEAHALIVRDPGGPNFRLFHVDTGASLTLVGLGLAGGRDQSDFGGGAISNRGTLRTQDVLIFLNTKTTASGLHTVGGAGISALGGETFLVDTEVYSNRVTEDEFANGLGGGILNGPWNGLGGGLEITRSSIRDNRSQRLGGGIFNGGALKVTDSTIHDNAAADTTGRGFGGGVYSQHGGSASFANTTIARNQNGGLEAGSAVILNNATIARNSGVDLTVVQAAVQARNTIVGNCQADEVANGRFTSLGNNVIENRAACTGTFLPSDTFADARLGLWETDTESFDLEPDSPAINAGNRATCLQTDQTGRPRIGRCDIGASEFRGRMNLVKKAKKQ